MVVTEAVAAEWKIQMEKPDLVFLTEDNREAVQMRIAPHVKAEIEKQEQVANERAAFEKRKIDDAISSTKRTSH